MNFLECLSGAQVVGEQLHSREPHRSRGLQVMADFMELSGQILGSENEESVLSYQKLRRNLVKLLEKLQNSYEFHEFSEPDGFD